MRRLAAVIPLALGVLALGHYLDDLRARRPILDAVTRYTIDIRRPLETDMIGYAPSADIAAQVLAAAALGDTLGTKRLTNLSPIERRAWLDVPLDLDEELAGAIEQQLIAIARNPGWPLHRYFLGKLAFTRDRRSLGGDAEPNKWMLPLESAWKNAPGHEQTVETLAGVLLESWRLLPEETRAMAPGVLQSALLDPQFVRLAFDVAADIVGRDTTFDALPDEPSPLMAATRALGRRGDLSDAATLYSRWEVAEWQARAADLEAMKLRLARGDWRGLLSASTTWGSRHRAEDFDTPEALQQLEDVLRLWPKDQVGSWNNDRRAEIARFFLNGRLDSIDPSVLDATVAALSSTPLPIRARVALAAGHLDKAESFVRAAGSEGGFEWTDYFVDLARIAVDRGDIDQATRAINRISPSARKECGVLVVRREAGEDLDPPAVSVTDDAGDILGEAWSSNGMLGFCVDPMSSGTKTLLVDLETGGPALLEWGLNAGRRETRLVDGTTRITLPLRGLTGRNVLFTRVLWGDRIAERLARVE